MGTNMDRDIYESYSDVVRWTTVLTLAAIRACYPVHDFQFDVSDAFQATRTDDDPSDSPKPLYYRQGPGFEVYGANGEKLVCRALKLTKGGLIQPDCSVLSLVARARSVLAPALKSTGPTVRSWCAAL